METAEKILVIDDERGILEGCRRVLEPKGFVVETADTLREGRQKNQAGGFDLVLLDVMLPDGRGIDLISEFLEKDPDIVTVIITGYATVELAVKAIKQGAYDFISKPFDSDMLLMTVNRGLEKRRLLLETKRLQVIEREAAEMARTKEEMERLNEFKSAFVLMVAHELRSPVNGAQSLVRTLLGGLAGELNPKQGELLARVEARFDSLLDLINDLLTLAAGKTIAAGQLPEAVPLGAVIRRFVEHYSVEAKNARVALVSEVPEKFLAVRAAPDDLNLIFGNLIGNAIKYTPPGGKVRIAMDKEGEQAVITVSDTGIGIPEESLAKIGEEYFRAANAKRAGIKGTGLGLSIVKQSLNRLGGQISVQSTEGKGTTFTLRLPLDPGVLDLPPK